MPPRFAYWTIIFGGQATAFRSASRDDLLPTFKQIQSKHPDAQLRYFTRGKLWFSEDEARAALLRERFEKTQRARPTGDRRPREGWKPGGTAGRPRREGVTPREGQRASGPKRRSSAGGRPPDWRPGGAHQDPRQRFKVPRDVKRARMARRFGWKKKKDDDK